MNKVCHYLLLAASLLAAGCANITAPTGGKKDTRPPKRLLITPGDSLTNTRLSRLDLTFDEYVTVNDAAKEVQISPMLSINPTVTGLKKRVTVKIPDTLLEPNTTYRISFGNAIRDLHEGNPYTGFTYTFSTGTWFDSLQLDGKVLNAATGMPDTAGVIVVLYYAKDGDSAVAKHKPKYITRADASGNFSFKGLPQKTFKIFAIKDDNDNMMFDGEGEKVAFANENVVPGNTASQLTLRMFIQPADTSIHPDTDTSLHANSRTGASSGKPPAFSYTVGVDTSNRTKRSFDITKDISISFTKAPALNKEKITLVYDSSGADLVAPHTVSAPDSMHRVTISANWKENTLYTLKLAKGFAKDSTGAEVMPGKFIFRTKEDEDYGKLSIHMPAKYATGYVLQVVADNDTVYQKPVTDTIVNMSRLKPGKYTFRLINDKNGNGKWDAGDLYLRKQPEEVIPYKDALNLKAGWENVVDFEPKQEAPKAPGKR